MMAEVLGKSSGYCKGKGGSMHIADVEHGNLGATGIVGGNLPVAVGAALAQKLQGTDRVVVCFFGDGASNEGNFHEALNMASAFNLPVVFVAENNLYGMSVPWNHVTKLPDIADRACAYGIPGEVVDGMDALVVREAVSRAAERARRGEGPTLIEAKTYRYYGHSHSDPRAYRTRDEEAEWKEDNDPINRLKADMQMVGWLGDDQFDVLDQTVKDKMAAAMAFANASPEPDAAEATTDVYAPSKTTAADVAAEAKLREQVRSAPDMRQITYAAGAGRGSSRGNDPGRQRLHHGRGRRALRRRVRRDARPLEGIRRLARARHADLRGDDRRRGRRRGDGGHAAHRRDHVRRLHPAGHGSDRQPGRQEPLYVRRQDRVPMVIRTEGGAGRAIAAHHSQSLEALWTHFPGIYVVMPSTPYDAKGLLKAAIRDDNPVMFIEHKMLYGTKGPVPEGDYIIPLGVADIKRPGKDVTLVTYSRMVLRALEAAEILAKEGIDVEVIDLRSLKPLDTDAIINSVKKTGRVVGVTEAYENTSFINEVMAVINDLAFDYLDAPMVRVAALNVPVPRAEVLEDQAIPNVARIVAACRKVVK